MIGPSQKQNTAKDSIAIQSGGDTNINNGLSANQMREIMECIADQLPRYAAIAASVVEERLKTFEEKIVQRFDKDPSTENRAFEDPDFQFLLLEAQKSFSRSGDENTAEILVDLISQRSKESSRTRRALNINKAVEVASQLTENEIAELAVIFCFRSVKFFYVLDERSLADYFNTKIVPFIDRISRETASYSYMESLGCGKISMGNISFDDVMRQSYPQATSVSPKIEQLTSQIEKDFIEDVIRAGLLRVSSTGKLLQVINNVGDFKIAIENCGLSSNQADDLFNMTAPTPFNSTHFIAELSELCPRIGEIMEIWDKTDLCRFELSGVGTSIGYFSLRRETDFDGDIDIWVK